jgi:hypothetical protein
VAYVQVIVFVIGLIVLYSGSGNGTNELERTPIGAKLFRSGLGWGLILATLIFAIAKSSNSI